MAYIIREPLERGFEMVTIRQARKAAGLTQVQLAELLGVTQGAVAQWENGQTHPSFGVLKPLAAVLGLTLEQLIEGDEDATIPDHQGGG